MFGLTPVIGMLEPPILAGVFLAVAAGVMVMVRAMSRGAGNKPSG